MLNTEENFLKNRSLFRVSCSKNYLKNVLKCKKYETDNAHKLASLSCAKKAGFLRRGRTTQPLAWADSDIVALGLRY